VVTRALIVLAGAIVPLRNLLSPPLKDLTWVLWPAALVSVLIWRAKDRQRNETASDQRAVALTGNPEALAQGLVKLYAWGRVPRRMPSDLEQRATHPSLARRIRDIRAAAGTKAPVPAGVEAFASLDGTTRVAFEPSRLRWTDGEAVEHALAYEALTELRVHASGASTPRLVAVDRSGHRWQMPLAAGDAARVQEVLDGVDGLLAHPARRSRISTSTVRACASLAVMLAFVVAQFAAAFTALVALISPSPSLLAGAGVASMAAAALAMRSGPRVFWPVILILTSIAALLCGLAYLRRHDEAPKTATKPLALLTTAAITGLVLIMSYGFSPVRLHQGARALPSVAVLSLAIGTALAWDRRRLPRMLAVVSIAIATIVVAVGSIPFLDRFGNDPLLARGQLARAREVMASPIAEYPLAATVSDIVLSPGGSGVLTSSHVERDSERPVLSPFSRYQVGRVGGTPRAVPADAAAFAGDDRLLTVRFLHGGAELRLVRVDAPDVELWQQRVDGIVSGRLGVDDEGRQWSLVGRAPDRTVVALHGQIGSTQMETHLWRVDRATWLSRISTAGSSAVGLQRRYELGPLAGPEFLGIVPLVLGTRSAARFWQLDARTSPSRESLLDTTCTDTVFADALVCVTYDGVQTRIAEVRADGGQVVPMRVIDGRFAMLGAGNLRGWLIGWGDRGATAIRLATGDAFSIPRTRNRYVRALAATDTRLAAIMNDARGSRLSLFALPH
jgi:hypothetical protein